MDWKIVFSDIDGTVLNSKHELLTSTIEAVQKISFKKIYHLYWCQRVCLKL